MKYGFHLIEYSFMKDFLNGNLSINMNLKIPTGHL